MKRQHAKINWDLALIEKMAGEGYKQNEIAKAQGRTGTQLANSIFNRKDVKEAYERGKANRNGSGRKNDGAAK